jgi:hypothetical protein
MMLATLFDFPWEDRRKLTFWSDVAIANVASPDAPVHSEDERFAELGRMAQYFARLWNERVNAPPRFDLISMLAHGEATRDLPSRPHEFMGNLMLLIVGGSLGFAIGWHTVLLVHLPIVLLAGAIGVWLFYVQHTFEGAYWTNKDEWDAGKAAVAGSSYFDLPHVLHWFTGNIGYHHIHHLASRIPNYRLREAFESSELLQSAPRLTLWSSLKCARLKLWDEQSRRMVGFGYRAKALA